MKIEIEVIESCNGFITCLKPTDWIQLASVIIAAIAAIASFITVRQQKKQFELANLERLRKYRPNYKIRFFEKNNEENLILDLENEGFHFFIPTKVYWKGNQTLECMFIKGDLVKKTNNIVKEERESLIIKANIPDGFTDTGIFKIEGYDIEDKVITLETPTFVFENNKIINHLQISKQYLR